MDEIERRMRDANPLPPRGDELSERAARDLAQILASAERAVPPPPRRSRWMLSLAAGVVLALAGTISLVAHPTPSYAAPPPLDAQPLQVPWSEEMTRLADLASQQPEPDTSGPVRLAWSGWYPDITVGDGSATYFVQPQETDILRNPDGSGSAVTLAGQVMWGDAARNHPATPGAVLARVDYGPGDFATLFGRPPTTSSAYPGYLTAAGFQATTAAQLVIGITAARQEWPFGGRETAALLRYVAATPGFELLGTVTDRLGRAGVAISAPDRGGALRRILVFDTGTGELLQAETDYLGGIPEYGIPPNSLSEYTAWRSSE